MSRFVVGIDLGTTNCALGYVDSEAPGPVQTLAVPQLVGPGEVAPRSTLPSFLLLPTEHEVAPAAMALPWEPGARAAVGTFAQARGAELPHRLVASAKSWLSSGNVDRTAAILPWRGADRDLPEGGERVSPVAASARYLAHLRLAWDAAHPDAPLAEQDVLVTVPASFDAVARELTVVAAREAGLPKITLLEEPQAAFYAWLASTGDAWRQKLVPGDVVLVCDIGGGTTDFTLIEITDEGGALALERVAVGDHILLGGDNMDLALAATSERTLGEQGKKLDAVQSRGLVHACRRAKEELLSAAAPDKVPVALVGRGSKLIGGTVRFDLERDASRALLIADEVICGFGRTGEWFGQQYFGFQADIMPIAKGLSSGYIPIGAVMFNDRVAKVLAEKGGELAHGYTYSGHPVCAAVALENIRLLQDEKIVETAKHEIAPYLASRWAELGTHALATFSPQMSIWPTLKASKAGVRSR